MYERSFNPRKRSLLKRSPPLIKRHLNHSPTETLNRIDLRVRRSRGRNHGAGNAELARAPRDALGHVARRRRHYTTLELLRFQVCNRICSAANLE